MTVKHLTITSLIVATLTICSWISIPSVVPFTLQTLAVFLLPLLLPTKFVFLSVSCYLLLGLLGFPVFANFQGGIHTLFGLTGGYIIGFILSILWLALTKRIWKIYFFSYFIFAMIGLCLCYLFGSLWFYYLYQQTQEVTITYVFTICVFPFIIPDTIKILLAMLLGKRLSFLQKSISS